VSRAFGIETTHYYRGGYGLAGEFRNVKRDLRGALASHDLPSGEGPSVTGFHLPITPSN